MCLFGIESISWCLKLIVGKNSVYICIFSLKKCDFKNYKYNLLFFGLLVEFSSNIIFFFCYLYVLYYSRVRYSSTWSSGDLGQQKQAAFSLHSSQGNTNAAVSTPFPLPIVKKKERKKRQHSVIYCKCPAWPPLLNVYSVQRGMQLSRKQQGPLLPLGSRHSNQKRAPCNSL